MKGVWKNNWYCHL